MPGFLEEEIAQTKPLTLVDRAAANLHRTAAIFLQEVADYLTDKGISPKQYNILRILRGAGNKGISCDDVAARLVSPDPDTTRLLDRLLARLEKTVRKMQNRQFRPLKQPELRKLIRLLETLRQSNTYRISTSQDSSSSRSLSA